MNAYALTDVGKMRSMNQDYVFSTTKAIGNLPNLNIVADGMGGHRAGDLASKYSVKMFTDFVAGSNNSKPITVISDGIRFANRQLLELAATNPDYAGMGTTFVVVTILGKSAYIANVGDSRLYVMDKGLRQVTRDHSLVEEMVQRGTIDRSEARTHEQKNVITRALGGTENVMPDFFEVELEEYSQLLLCSDGLTNMVTDEEIEKVMSGRTSIEEKARRLVEMANDNGGKDNISVVIVEP